MDHDRLVSTMRTLALRAGVRIMEIYERGEIEVDAKADDSPVTAADRAADALIAEGLRDAFPDLPLVTEEQADSHDVTAGTFLIVDPLDGTKEFINRRGDFTVNIALVENGRPIRGVVWAPARARLFYTDADGRSVEETGSFDPDRPGQTTPIGVAPPTPGGLFVVASKSHRDPQTDAYISRYDVAVSKNAGSSLKFCLVATGEAHLYPRLGPTMEWDTAAGHALVTGAGGRVVRFDDHAELRYGKDGFRNPAFIAHAPWVELRGDETPAASQPDRV